jgi:hypothetical protein
MRWQRYSRERVREALWGAAHVRHRCSRPLAIPELPAIGRHEVGFKRLPGWGKFGGSSPLPGTNRILLHPARRTKLRHSSKDCSQGPAPSTNLRRYTLSEATSTEGAVVGIERLAHLALMGSSRFQVSMNCTDALTKASM